MTERVGRDKFYHAAADIEEGSVQMLGFSREFNLTVGAAADSISRVRVSNLPMAGGCLVPSICPVLRAGTILLPV
jgi:hypothetical protein